MKMANEKTLYEFSVLRERIRIGPTLIRFMCLP